MALGAFTFDTGASSTTVTGSSYTTCDVVTFSAPVVLRSVLQRFYSTGIFTGNAVIYDAAGTLIAQGPTQSLSVANSTTLYDIPFTSPIPLAANTQYKIGYYSGSNAQPGLDSGGTAGQTIASSPTGVTMTRVYSGVYYGSGAGNPTTNWTAMRPAGGVSVDVRATPTSTVPAFNATASNFSTLTFSWSNPGLAQTGYEFGYRKRASRQVDWTLIQNLSTSTQSITFPAETFEDGDYDWFVALYDAQGRGNATDEQFVTISSGWTTQTEVSSSTPSGIINASAFTVGTYDVEVRLADASNRYGNWSPLQTFTLGPPSNIWVKQGGTLVQATNKVKIGGVWVDVPPTKVKIGGTFV